MLQYLAIDSPPVSIRSGMEFHCFSLYMQNLAVEGGSPVHGHRQLFSAFPTTALPEEKLHRHPVKPKPFPEAVGQIALIGEVDALGVIRHYDKAGGRGGQL